MKQLLEFSSRFQLLRWLFVALCLLLIGSNMLWSLAYGEKAERAFDKVYVVSQGGTFPALLTDPDAPSIYEARNHVKAFMKAMFAHDERSYGEHIETALHLIEKSEGAAIFEDFQKGSVYDNYVKFGSRSVFEIDSVFVDMNTEPYEGKVYGRQTVIYREDQKSLPVGAGFELIQVPRSEANPFGLLIQNWTFILYQNEFQEP